MMQSVSFYPLMFLLAKFSMLYWSLLALRLFGFLSFMYVGMWAATKLLKDEYQIWKKQLEDGWRLPQKLHDPERGVIVQAVGKVSTRVFLTLIVFFCGYEYRIANQYQNMHALYNVSVLDRTGSEYRMATDDRIPFTTRFCDDKVPDFQPGYRLTSLIYEDRGNCWSVAPDGTQYIIARK